MCEEGRLSLTEIPPCDHIAAERYGKGGFQEDSRWCRKCSAQAPSRWEVIEREGEGEMDKILKGRGRKLTGEGNRIVTNHAIKDAGKKRRKREELKKERKKERNKERNKDRSKKHKKTKLHLETE